MTGPEFEFSEVFDDDYLYFYGPQLAAVSETHAETIWRLLDLSPGMEVLDLACGHGRIANRLAQRGARLTGLDAMPLFLDQARRDASEGGVEVDYVLGDMRSLPWPDHRFDRVISWFTSFGYFDDTENHQVLSEAHRVLGPAADYCSRTTTSPSCCPVGCPLSCWSATALHDRPVNVRAGDGACRAPKGRVSAMDRFDGSDSRSAVHWSELQGWLLAAGFNSVNQSTTERSTRLPRQVALVSVAHKEFTERHLTLWKCQTLVLG